MTGSPFELEPIGVVLTPFETSDDAPRQGLGGEEPAHGDIVLSPAFEPGLAGIDAGETVDVLWIADEADRSILRVRDGERGVFSTRSPHRPNPICVTTCRVRAVDGRRLAVSGVDMLDGSPVVDLKAPLE
ncbi:tRNA-Thr(GGU) m(6)t(6)A37 methyltransferase TsaA [Halobiforma haloterrestris]|uniref:tRNA-Thr(GGU) m(6)t(6)A37 methyltransferase TsaA n=1 Tax=Natronobacterium haloterrestre TaxID=148448 RepID=A0A1I1JBL3_NATHA|nr:tRNA (N6-threonylcarbamoyladenosine(37)-N6)-methyltransferase TrmO [Halobiforma haloterrestris]SFC45999.1 tRNA-Thr(GGU) m(6)t(6)A37 methyltransferase TsaA [Halobiforma haloterrestris]